MTRPPHPTRKPAPAEEFADGDHLSPCATHPLVYPRFDGHHVVSFAGMVPFYPGRRTVMPPLGLLTFAGCLPSDWPVRLIDENVQPLAEADLRWADVVALSGMHPQRRRIQEILRQANALGKLTVLGGPSVSITPECYPQANLLHIGELGDGTAQLLDFLGTGPGKPARQLVFETGEKTPLDEQPLPVWRLLDVHRYLVMPLQFSVGCPYRCEFCDIPVIYGRQPRAKSAARVIRELQAIYDTGFVGTLSFVDDNLIGDRRALHELLPELVRWQQAHRYPYPLSGEASLDLARDPESLQGLHDARCTHLFVGVESPDGDTLHAIAKKHNTRQPILEAIRSIQTHGIEVMLGLILGFDNDTERTGERIVEFVEESAVPFVLLNLLAALPQTPLWHRLEAEGRLLPAPDDDTLRSDALLTAMTTNVRYRLPNAVVVAMLHNAVRNLYGPDSLYRRLRWNAEHVYGRQIQGLPPMQGFRQTCGVLMFTLGILLRVVWGIGVRGGHRRQFWGYLRDLVRWRWQGRIHSILEVLLRVTPNAYHLITWGENLLRDHASQSAGPLDVAERMGHAEPAQASIRVAAPSGRKLVQSPPRQAVR